MRNLPHVSMLLLLACSSPRPVPQGVVSVGDDVACARCTIEIQRVVTLGTPDDSVDFSFELLFVARDRAGRTYLGPTMQSRVLVYSDDGKLVRSLARSGRGPGELNTPATLAVGPNDTLLVFDRVNGLLIFGPDLQFVRG